MAVLHRFYCIAVLSEIEELLLFGYLNSNAKFSLLSKIICSDNSIEFQNPSFFSYEFFIPLSLSVLLSLSGWVGGFLEQ